MDNECVAFGDYLNHFPQENTTIVNCPLSIVNSGRQLDKYEFVPLQTNPVFGIIVGNLKKEGIL